MAQTAPAQTKIPTENPQLTSRRPRDRVSMKARNASRTPLSALAGGTGRASTRGEDRVVIELECGVTVYPAREAGGRWRAVWYEDKRRRQCEASSEEKLTAKLVKILERLTADAPNMERPGADLIAWYLSPERRREPWSRKHTDTQRRLCQRFITPVIGQLVCQDVRVADMQQAINAAPTSGEGERLGRCISALVTAGIAGGYLVNPRLKDVHWQAGDRLAAPVVVREAGESALFVDPTDIPSQQDVAKLGQALAVNPAHGSRYELMALFAACTGLRWGELASLAIAQIETTSRTVTVDRKVIEVGGTIFIEAPKGRKRRRTIYPRCTPEGYPLAEMIASRIREVRAEQETGANPLGLVFPSPRGKYWRSSNFTRRVLQPAYIAVGWRDADNGTPGNGSDGHGWTWHSLRHVFCTTALFTWRIEPADVSRLAGHANIRTTLDMYVGNTAGVLDRARTATE